MTWILQCRPFLQVVMIICSLLIKREISWSPQISANSQGPYTTNRSRLEATKSNDVWV